MLTLSMRQFTYLIEGVLSLRLASNIATTTFSAHCVNLVDEENTGRGLAGRGKHVPGDFDMETIRNYSIKSELYIPDSRRSDTDKHFKEL